MEEFFKDIKILFICVELCDIIRFLESNDAYLTALGMNPRPSDEASKANLADSGKTGGLMSMLKEGREFLVRTVTFGGVNFDPLFTKFAVYPLAGLIIVVPLVETLVAPLTRFTILNQVNSDEWKATQSRIDEVFQQHGGFEAFFSLDLEELNAMREKVGEILVKQGGYKGLWDGKSISILHRLAFYGTDIFSYFGFKSLLQGIFGPISLNPVTACVCGGLSTLIATFASHPLDTLRTRVEAQTSIHRYGAQDVYDNICREGHFRSLYAGLLPSLLGSISSMTITAVFYESLTKVSRGIRSKDYRLTTSLVCSILASLAASTATFPMEVVKTRMQVEGEEGSNNMNAMVEKYKEIVVEKDGVGGLYRGIQPHCLKVVVGNAVSFLTYEIVRIPCCLATMGLSFMFGFYDIEAWS